jgi:hypothetical protein
MDIEISQGSRWDLISIGVSPPTRLSKEPGINGSESPFWQVVVVSDSIINNTSQIAQAQKQTMVTMKFHLCRSGTVETRCGEVRGACGVFASNHNTGNTARMRQKNILLRTWIVIKRLDERSIRTLHRTSSDSHAR